jgi:hypothetical protein
MAGFLHDSGDRQRADLAHPGCAIVPDDLLTSVRQARKYPYSGVERKIRVAWILEGVVMP